MITVAGKPVLNQPFELKISFAGSIKPNEKYKCRLETDYYPEGGKNPQHVRVLEGATTWTMLGSQTHTIGMKVTEISSNGISVFCKNVKRIDPATPWWGAFYSGAEILTTETDGAVIVLRDYEAKKSSHTKELHNQIKLYMEQLEKDYRKYRFGGWRLFYTKEGIVPLPKDGDPNQDKEKSKSDVPFYYITIGNDNDIFLKAAHKYIYGKNIPGGIKVLEGLTNKNLTIEEQIVLHNNLGVFYLITDTVDKAKAQFLKAEELLTSNYKSIREKSESLAKKHDYLNNRGCLSQGKRYADWECFGFSHEELNKLIHYNVV